MTVQEAQVDDLHESDDEEFVDELTPGTQLMHGQYTIESFLNSGGFGITYLARDSLDRLVVIKECFPGSFCRRQNASVVARSRAHQAELRSIVRLFTQEARSLAKAGHPNIVGVHQVFEDNGTAYMALDYVEGMDLLEIITETPGVLTPAQIRSYLVKMLDAVSFVHKQGILHRDISPDNILIRADNEPVLIDFGAAREEASKQSRLLSALRVVKDGYSPQEFYVAGSEQSNSCDLYSLAASFYHIITGELPPDSQMRLAAAAAGDPDPFVSLSKRTTEFDAVFCDSLDKAMSVLPRERIQSAEDWIAMLNGEAPVVEPKPFVSKRTATPRKVQVESTKKSKMPMLLGTTAVVVAIAAGGYFATQGGLDTVVAELTAPSETQDVSDVTAVFTAPAPIVAEAAETQAAIEAQDSAPFISTPDEIIALAPPSILPDAAIDPLFDNLSDATILPAPEATPLTVDTLPAGVELVTPEAATVTEELSAGVELDAPQTPTSEVLLPEGVELLNALPEGVELVSPNEEVSAGSEEIASVVAEPTETAVVETLEPSSVMGAHSHAGLPFTLSETDPGVVESVMADAPFWVAEGTRILLINGEPISNSAQAEALLKDLSKEASESDLRLDITTQAQVSGAAIDRELRLPIVHETLLLNGLGFEARLTEDETWITKVVTAPDGSSFQVGDQVIAFMQTSERIEGPTTLRDIVSRNLETGLTNFSFAIQRDGQMWVESFTLTN